jgi:hypothetical protein
MNIDNQLMLGIVFLTAGVAMGLLAYAAVLNRRSGNDDAEQDEQESADTAAPEEADIGEAQPVPSAEPSEPAVPAGAPLPSTPLAADDKAAPPPAPPIATDISAQPAKATLQRDERSGRLVVQIGDSVYRSIEGLRDSPDWQRVDHLFSDLLAWMVNLEAMDRASEDTTKASEQSAKPSAPLSMVEQINEVLSAKLADHPDATRAVHLLETPDGSIRVYIGVNSYAIEDVPDENVRSLIRQAVAEWESQQ